ncbi:DUF4394 domain-containing protein [Alishewanella jeotgali]|uniref:DUF4394 domain-containing protein n=1 Tax=Alishewanella jeotgali KCTC 22429 TaxID=1129374 RepID=H3ZAD5_9ALTE|nr:DUF4394 domain-containing protein [Alishewanella jeotgali]EHR42489.1 hypothetical protein AJE_01369 [Alishewanella jeotgali KCTC 22429]
MTVTTKTCSIAAALLLSPLYLQAMPELKGNEQLWLLTAEQQLVKVAAKAPQQIIEQRALQGLSAAEQLIGIDYRVAYGVLFGLSNQGQLYQINTTDGSLTKVGTALPAGTLTDAAYGFDFNPAADRIRVVNVQGQNLRLHPETGALAFTDPKLHYAADDVNANKQPTIVAAAYTYNQQNEKLTTNYAIDLAQGTLVTQGSIEGQEPAVSPNTGTLFTVGSLGLAALSDVAFDISDLRNIGLLAVSKQGATVSSLYQVDLASGKTLLLGELPTTITGIAIEP